MVLNILIFFIGTTASGHTSKGINEKGAKLNARMYDHLLNSSVSGHTLKFAQIKASINSCNGESSCLKPVIDDHFPQRLNNRIINHFASTGKNDSKQTEKPESALNLPKLSKNGELENYLL